MIALALAPRAAGAQTSETTPPSAVDAGHVVYPPGAQGSATVVLDLVVEKDGRVGEVNVVDGEEPFVLHPGEFVLASTYEVVSLPDDIAGRLEGKSSLGRLGLLTHSTAGWIDPGFSGHVTLELSNVATLPIKLWPGMKIGQLCLFRTSSPAEHPYGSVLYGSRYQDQRGPTPSRSFLNFYRAQV